MMNRIFSGMHIWLIITLFFLQGCSDQNPIEDAIYADDIESIEKIIQKGEHKNREGCWKPCRSALEIAIGHGNPKILEVLLMNGLGKDSETYGYHNPYYAVLRSFTSDSSPLENSILKIFSSNKDLDSIEKYHSEMIRFLIKYEVPFSGLMNDFATTECNQYSVFENSFSISAIKLLVKSGLNPYEFEDALYYKHISKYEGNAGNYPLYYKKGSYDFDYPKHRHCEQKEFDYEQRISCRDKEDATNPYLLGRHYPLTDMLSMSKQCTKVLKTLITAASYYPKDMLIGPEKRTFESMILQQIEEYKLKIKQLESQKNLLLEASRKSQNATLVSNDNLIKVLEEKLRDLENLHSEILKKKQ